MGFVAARRHLRAISRLVAVVAAVSIVQAPCAGQSPPGTLPMLPGLAVAHQQVDLAASVSGALLELHVAEGDRVEAGQLLAVMDNRVARAAVEVAQAVAARHGLVERAEGDVRAARALLTRLERAHAERAVSDVELEQAQTSLEQADAALTQAREQLTEAQQQLELEQAKLEAHNLRAPFAGEVVYVAQKLGAIPHPGEKLITLVNRDQLRVELQVPVEWFGRLATGETYQLSAEAPVSTRLEARLTYQEPTIDSATKSFRCVFLIDNPAGHLPVGFLVHLSPDALTAPVARAADPVSRLPSPPNS